MCCRWLIDIYEARSGKKAYNVILAVIVRKGNNYFGRVDTQKRPSLDDGLFENAIAGVISYSRPRS